MNEYTPGQGIAPHVDCVPCFGPFAASLSLGSSCEMLFQRVATAEIQKLHLPRGRVRIVSAPSRHSLPLVIVAAHHLKS
ncbi:MAG: alpha-ketoglutarate-dependent dioxygenase AlkB [Pseudomonadota bacterium]